MGQSLPCHLPSWYEGQVANDKVSHIFWLGKLNKGGLPGLALSSNGMGIPISGWDSMWDAKHSIPYHPLHTQTHLSILKAPRSQAFKTLTCFDSLDVFP